MLTFKAATVVWFTVAYAAFSRQWKLIELYFDSREKSHKFEIFLVFMKILEKFEYRLNKCDEQFCAWKIDKIKIW